MIESSFDYEIWRELFELAKIFGTGDLKNFFMKSKIFRTMDLGIFIFHKIFDTDWEWDFPHLRIRGVALSKTGLKRPQQSLC